MKINTSIELSRIEIAEALTDYIKELTKYKDEINHLGEVISMSFQDQIVRVEWGEKEEPEKEKDECVCGYSHSYHAGAPGNPERPLKV